MSERHTLDDFEGSQFRNLVEGFPCPNERNGGTCGQLVRFTEFEEDGEASCPRCGAQMSVEVIIDGSRNPT